jgi:hypothetical protein
MPGAETPAGARIDQTGRLRDESGRFLTSRSGRRAGREAEACEHSEDEAQRQPRGPVPEDG